MQVFIKDLQFLMIYNEMLNYNLGDNERMLKMFMTDCASSLQNSVQYCRKHVKFVVHGDVYNTV